MVFEKLENRLIIEGEITALMPLHVGSGRPEVRIGEVISVVRNSEGTPYIPGSSLKGKIRTEVEKIEKKLGKFVCDPPETKEMCGSKTNDETKLCVVCQVFGTAGNKLSRASKVKFRDALAVGSPGKETRIGIALDRETGSVHEQALYKMEAIPAGTKFKFEIVGENLSDDELKLLWEGMESVQDAGLGGSSTRGLGKVKIEILKVRERSAEFYKGQKDREGIFEGETLGDWKKRKGCDL